MLSTGTHYVIFFFSDRCVSEFKTFPRNQLCMPTVKGHVINCGNNVTNLFFVSVVGQEENRVM